MKKLLSIVLLFVSTVAFTQVEKGDKEIGLSGNFNAPTEGGGGNGMVALMFNQYFTPHISLAVSAAFALYSGPSDVTDPNSGNELKITPFIGTFFTYNFLTGNGKVLPYVGVEYTFSWLEVTDVETVPISTPPYYYSYTLESLELLHFLGGKAGMKIFITENVNFDANLKYQTLLAGPEGYNAGNIGINFGIGIILPRKKK